MARLVQKFGGSSVKDSRHMQNVARIIANTYREGKELVVVVSAMGDKTDELIELASQISEQADPRELDVLLATGEQVSISLLALAIQAQGLKARSFTGPQAGIITDDTHGFARIKTVQPTRIESCLRAGEIAVVAGFQGMTRSSELSTLGRGGSDTTAVALAAALKAECCDIYTDVDGVYTSDPRTVANARRLAAISYEEMLALSSHGAQVLNARSVELAMKNKMPIRLRSTFAPEDTGTLVSGKELTPEYQVAGVACDAARVSMLLNWGQDFAAPFSSPEEEKLTQAKIEHSIEVLLDSLEEIGLSRNAVLFRKADALVTELRLNCEKRIARQVQSALELTAEEFPNSELKIDTNVATVSLVGTGVHTDKNLKHELVKTLSEIDVPVSMLTMDKLSLSALIPSSLSSKAICKIHERFCLESSGQGKEHLRETVNCPSETIVTVRN